MRQKWLCISRQEVACDDKTMFVVLRGHGLWIRLGTPKELRALPSSVFDCDKLCTQVVCCGPSALASAVEVVPFEVCWLAV
jgi:hypothetical protein